jgi:hypothetical protein
MIAETTLTTPYQIAFSSIDKSNIEEKRSAGIQKFKSLRVHSPQKKEGKPTDWRCSKHQRIDHKNNSMRSREAGIRIHIQILPILTLASLLLGHWPPCTLPQPSPRNSGNPSIKTSEKTAAMPFARKQTATSRHQVPTF